MKHLKPRPRVVLDGRTLASMEKASGQNREGILSECLSRWVSLGNKTLWESAGRSPNRLSSRVGTDIGEGDRATFSLIFVRIFKNLDKIQYLSNLHVP